MLVHAWGRGGQNRSDGACVSCESQGVLHTSCLSSLSMCRTCSCMNVRCDGQVITDGGIHTPSSRDPALRALVYVTCRKAGCQVELLLWQARGSRRWLHLFKLSADKSKHTNITRLKRTFAYHMTCCAFLNANGAVDCTVWFALTDLRLLHTLGPQVWLCHCSFPSEMITNRHVLVASGSSKDAERSHGSRCARWRGRLTAAGHHRPTN